MNVLYVILQIACEVQHQFCRLELTNVRDYTNEIIKSKFLHYCMSIDL